jgi:hypothetical protein
MKLRDEIAQGAIGVTKTLRHFGQGLAFHDDGPKGLVASLQRGLRVEEELSADGVIHDLPSELSLLFWGKHQQNGTVPRGRSTRKKVAIR